MPAPQTAQSFQMLPSATPDVLEAQLNNEMIRSAREVDVVTDFSKSGRRRVSRIGPLEKIWV